MFLGLLLDGLGGEGRGGEGRGGERRGGEGKRLRQLNGQSSRMLKLQCLDAEIHGEKVMLSRKAPACHVFPVPGGTKGVFGESRPCERALLFYTWFVTAIALKPSLFRYLPSPPTFPLPLPSLPPSLNSRSKLPLQTPPQSALFARLLRGAALPGGARQAVRVLFYTWLVTAIALAHLGHSFLPRSLARLLQLLLTLVTAPSAAVSPSGCVRID
ncbi:unnamed protein product [Closterium sp. NIES-54]